MQTNELRIGNYVLGYSSVNYMVRGILEKKIQVSRSFTTIKVDFKLSEIEPIPLTEEWLLKFGFETRIDSEGFFFKGIAFYKGFLTDNQKNKIEFVHQLQNLYFALTGEELTVNN